jgi:hypothetical protein
MAEKEWTDELKQEVKEAYLALDPTPENTIDLVKQVAEEFKKTPNGVRMVLTRSGAYVKKAIPTTASKGSEGASKRVNKTEAINDLKKAIKDSGQEVNDDICDRLTGKAAVYIKGLLE